MGETVPVLGSLYLAWEVHINNTKDHFNGGKCHGGGHWMVAHSTVVGMEVGRLT